MLSVSFNASILSTRTQFTWQQPIHPGMVRQSVWRHFHFHVLSNFFISIWIISNPMAIDDSIHRMVYSICTDNIDRYCNPISIPLSGEVLHKQNRYCNPISIPLSGEVLHKQNRYCNPIRIPLSEEVLHKQNRYCNPISIPLSGEVLHEQNRYCNPISIPLSGEVLHKTK